jgi:hypothetical protein
MKTPASFLLAHALVLGGAFLLRDRALSAATLLACSFTASLLALAWLDLSRPIEPLRPRATLRRPELRDRSSRRATAPLRKAA